MLTPTHLVAGQTTFLLVTVIAGHQPTLTEALLAAAASVIPDLDSKQSYIGRTLPFISGPLESYFGHRTVTHSLVIQVFAGFLAYTVLPYGYFLAIMAGWLSHSMAEFSRKSLFRVLGSCAAIRLRSGGRRWPSGVGSQRRGPELG